MSRISVNKLRQIGTAAKVQSGFAFKSQDFTASGVRLLRNTNVSPGKINWDDTAFLPEEKSHGLDRYEIREGDIIISLDRPIISNGIKVARIDATDLPCLLVQRVGRFLLDESLLDSDYLYAFIQTDKFKQAISGHDQSLGVPHISPEQVEAVEIPLLPINDQRRIASQLKTQLTAVEEAQRGPGAACRTYHSGQRYHPPERRAPRHLLRIAGRGAGRG